MGKKLFSKIILFLIIINICFPVAASAEKITIYFPPDWQEKANDAKIIAEKLSENSGLDIKPLIAKSYHQILDAFMEHTPALVYIGSFVQSVLYSRNLSLPLAQGINGKELYTGVLITPASAGNDPVLIVKNAGANIAYAKSTSSGETAAKAASNGIAEIAVISQTAAANAVKVGKAKAAFVKNLWWEDNKNKYSGLKSFNYPRISDIKHPDYIVSANRHLNPKDLEKIMTALKNCKEYFKVNEFKKFDPELLEGTLQLMKKAKIDIENYKW
ncbi:MAG: PhnD/SsuA/transferrin family substrate-binding protein [bacterium]